MKAKQTPSLTPSSIKSICISANDKTTKNSYYMYYLYTRVFFFVWLKAKQTHSVTTLLKKNVFIFVQMIKPLKLLINVYLPECLLSNLSHYT